MKIVAISDTHGKHRQLDIPADVDMLVHAGDITFNGEYDILSDFNDWLGHLSWIEHRIVIAGNHDITFQSDPETARSHLTNAIYLQDNLVEVDGIRVYGSPWTPRFGGWAFMSERGEDMKKHWEPILDIKPDILLTHGPPYGTLDKTREYLRVGCEELKKAVDSCQPKLHVFGHIHEDYGRYQRPNKTTTYVNASSVNRQYQIAHKPQVITLA